MICPFQASRLRFRTLSLFSHVFYTSDPSEPPVNIDHREILYSRKHHKYLHISISMTSVKGSTILHCLWTGWRGSNRGSFGTTNTSCYHYVTASLGALLRTPCFTAGRPSVRSGTRHRTREGACRWTMQIMTIQWLPHSSPTDRSNDTSVIWRISW